MQRFLDFGGAFVALAQTPLECAQVVFQRCTVMVADLVLVLGALAYTAGMPETRRDGPFAAAPHLCGSPLAYRMLARTRSDADCQLDFELPALSAPCWGCSAGGSSPLRCVPSPRAS